MAKRSDVKREVFSTRLDIELLNKVRHLAVDERCQINDLLEEAIRLLLVKKKRS